MKKVFLLLTTALILAGAKCSDLEQSTETNYYNYEYQEDNDMALSFKDDATLAGRYQTEDTDYPNGTFKDAVVGNDGTPYTAEIMQNIDGLLQALLALGKITASGDPDTATYSQYLLGLLVQYGGGFNFRNSSATSLNYTNYNYLNITSDGILSGGLGDAQTTVYKPVVLDISSETITWNTTTDDNLISNILTIDTGLPKAVDVLSSTLRYTDSSGDYFTAPAFLTINPDGSGDNLEIKLIKILTNDIEPATDIKLVLLVDVSGL